MNQLLENKWNVSLLAGLLLGLSFPPVNLSFLTIPAFALLLHLVNSTSSKKELFKYVYPGLVLWNVITTYWLTMASFGAGLGAILANSLVMMLPLLMMRFFNNRFSSSILVAVLQTSAWVSYEFLHHHWDLSWPWLAIGNAWANQISLIQYISITGHLGISFWVVLTAALAYQAFRHQNKQVGIAAISLFLLLPLGSLIYFGIDQPVLSSEQNVAVTVIQPNHDSYEDFGGMSGNREVLDSLFSVTSKMMSPESELIVWPENALDRAILMNSIEVTRIADSALSWNTNFIVGGGFYTLFPDSVPDLYYGVTRNNTPFNIYNSALFVDANGKRSRYDKNHLVPFVERFAFVNFFAKLDMFGWVNWGKLAGFGKGMTNDMLETQSFSTPGLVCYDSVYPGWIRKFVQNGAGFITIITNDGWWGDSSGHRQHFAYARLRAIEFNRWIVRSANNGTSGIIRPDGTIEQTTDYWIRTGFNSIIPVLSNLTIYARFGNWLPVLSLFLTTAFWVFGWFTRKTTSSFISNE